MVNNDTKVMHEYVINLQDYKYKFLEDVTFVTKKRLSSILQFSLTHFNPYQKLHVLTRYCRYQ
ncbi:hypothetical protein HanIR_Chr02g0093931 [Helianthus annuus]|nr:hypothetical protein HanIR_Chr02g0093931 [Helianthus annuus]